MISREQTLGNDNSVTGFSDQSKNVQAAVGVTPTPVVTPTPTSVVTPTPIVTPTPTPTPRPTPTPCADVEDSDAISAGGRSLNTEDIETSLLGGESPPPTPGDVCPPGEDESATNEETFDGPGIGS